MSGIPSWARVGAKVVCVSSPPKGHRFRQSLTVGVIYTLRGVGYDYLNDEAGVWLVEVENGPAPCRGYGLTEPGYKVEHFRPVRTIEDDLEAHFNALLDAKPSIPVEA